MLHTLLMIFRVVYELSKYYLKDQTKKTLRKTVRCYEDYLTKYFPIPHPSPTNVFGEVKIYGLH